METPPCEVVFSPELYESGQGCVWHFDHPALLSMNEWFIAGPGPGVYRDEWLEAAQRFKKQAKAGKGRIALLGGNAEHAWLRPGQALRHALALVPGDALYVCVQARVTDGAEGKEEVLSISFAGAIESGTVASLKIPADGAWHEADAMPAVPEPQSPDSPLCPVLRLAPSGTGAHIAVRALILGIEDMERMTAVNRLLHDEDGKHLCRCTYERDDLKWVAAAYTQYFLFAYDSSFYNPETGYQVGAFVEDKRKRFGGVDSVILWPGYPRIGVDDRNQFDFFRDMPGGMEGLRDVCRQFREQGVRVLLPYLPWDTSTRRENAADEAAMAALVQDLGADGVFLDTLGDASVALRSALDAAREGIALVPELRPPMEQLRLCNASWAQWPHDPTPPGMPLLKWFEPRHTQYFTCRWERSHRWEIETAFFNGTGMLLWENVFGTRNPVTPSDALLWKRCSAILRVFHREFSSDLWDPFYPALGDDLYVHRWPGAPTTLFTLRNMGEAIKHGPLVRWQLPPHVRADNMRIYDVMRGQIARWDMTEFGWVQVWGDVDGVGCIAVCFGDDQRLDDLIALQSALDTTATDGTVADKSLFAPPALRPVSATDPAPKESVPESMVYVPGGAVRMRIAHQRRESGCYPDPDADLESRRTFMWGHPHDGMVGHDYTAQVAPFFMDEAQVSNGDFQRFLQETGYAPKHPHNFLKHWQGLEMPEGVADLPVVYVDLDDARAYAQWAGKRLPTEPEWQLAAQGGDGRRWPWGDSFVPAYCPPAGNRPMPVRSLPDGRSPHGCYLMAGNVWEWTESERSDGSTRYCIIRGGSFHHIAEGSGWYAPSGPQPLDSHAKFLLLWPGLDRCATIGFRCVRDATHPQ